MVQSSASSIYLSQRQKLTRETKSVFISLSSFFASHRSPLYLACISGHALIVQELINSGADPAMPDLHYWYPIHRATLWSHINVMRVLIKAGADVNMEDDEGVCLVLIIDRSTSLQNGITLKLLSCCLLLRLKSMRSIGMFLLGLQGLFCSYQTPLEIAFLNDRLKVARVLRKAGGDVSPEFLKQLPEDARERCSNYGK